MKKTIAFVTGCAFLLSPGRNLKADQAVPAQVGKAAEEGVDTAKTRTWIPIVIAVAIVAAATVALVVIHQDNR